MQSASHVEYDEERVKGYNSEGRLEHPQSQLPYITWLRLLGDVRGMNVLDLACGNGHTSRMLAERGAKVYGVDVSLPQIELAVEEEMRSPMGIRYLVCDAEHLDFDEKFDIVTPSFLFHYAQSRDKLRRMVERVVAHLKPGGRMVALMTHPDEPIVPLIPHASHYTHWEGPAWREGSPIRMHILDLSGKEVSDFQYYYWSRKTYEALMVGAGLKSLQWYEHIMPDDMRKRFLNWRSLEEHNASAVLVAHKK